MTRNDLYEKYPSLFKQRKLGPEKSCMCWGIEVNKGWFKLIDELSEKILDVCPEAEYVQIKEKFGTLRAYLHNGNDAAYSLINVSY